MDINGDGIPDFVSSGSDDGNAECHYGFINETNGRISFEEKGSTISLGGHLNETVSKTNVTSLGVSPYGGAKFNISSSGKLRSSSGNFGTGGSWTDGTSNTVKGFLDLNGDGLPDYVSESGIKYNYGDDFKKEGLSYSVGNISESKSLSSGGNTNFGGGGQFSDSLTTGISANGSLNKSSSSNSNMLMYLDINGDGLADMLKCVVTETEISPATETAPAVVEKDVCYRVAYNLGNKFGSEQEFKLPDWSISYEDKENLKKNVDGKLNFENLKDIVIGDFSLSQVISDWIGGVTDVSDLNECLEYSSTASLGYGGSLGFNGNVSFPIFWGLQLNITANVGSGLNASASLTGASSKFTDIDGDGYVDQVLRVPGAGLYVKRNLMGDNGAGLLKSVKCSNGAEWDIGYRYMSSTVDMPAGKYVLNTVTVHDGTEGLKLPGCHSIVKEFEYRDGKYDRLEKEFYGFSSVDERFVNGNAADRNHVRTLFNNSEYFSKGTEKSSTVYGEDGRELQHRETILLGEFDSSKHSDSILPYAEVSVSYDMTDKGQKISHGTLYSYDEYGNVTGLNEYAAAEIKWNKNFSGELLRTLKVGYDKRDSGEDYIVSGPVLMEVFDEKETLLRKRTGEYNDEGELIKLNQFWDENDFLSYGYTYDDYGNMKTVTLPGKIGLEYEYDEDNNAYNTKVMKKSRGGTEYISTAEYNYSLGQKLKETDINDKTFFYEYDSQGRPTKIFSPYDDEKGIACAEYEYHTPDLLNDEKGEASGLWYAFTKNKISFDKSNKEVMETATVADAMGRTVLVAKQGIYNKVDDSANGAKGKTGWNVSGFAEYDYKGRCVKQYQNYFVNGERTDLLSSIKNLEKNINATLFTSVEYDVLDRTVRTTYPNDAELGECFTESEYSIRNGHRITRTVDPLGNSSESESDVLGNVVRSERTGATETGAEINCVSGTAADTIDCISSKKERMTRTWATYKYDALGQMVKAWDAKDNPVTVEYDLLGRKLSLESRDSGKDTWVYDGRGLMVRSSTSALSARGKAISYEYDDFARLVKVDYPDSYDTEYVYSDEAGTKGKLVKVTDETGETEYEYGDLGETTKEIRTICANWNSRGSNDISAVTEYRSNYLGQMEWIKYPDGEKIVYGYDAGGNVCSVKGEKSGVKESVYVESILYDEFGQRNYIKYGNGVETFYRYNAARRWLSNVETLSGFSKIQDISYKFDGVGNPVAKTDICDGWKTSQVYTYDGLYQLTKVSGHAVNTVPESMHGLGLFDATYVQEFSFSDDGLCNMTSKTSSESEVLEDDLNYKLDYEYDENFVHRAKRIGTRYYRYDESGNILEEREASFGEDGLEVKVESLGSVGSVQDENSRAGELFGMNYAVGHYNAEKENEQNSGKVSSRKYAWNERNLMTHFSDGNKYLDFLYGADGQRAIKNGNNAETLYYSKFFVYTLGNAFTGLGSMQKHIFVGSERIATKECPVTVFETFGTCDTRIDSENTYWYHTDHLGNVGVVTDCKGEVYERLEYTPYGEVWLDHRKPVTRFSSPYRFTGKQLDEESGLYYFGARYLDPRYSRWMSTDPALNEYVSGSKAGGGIGNTFNLHLYNYGNNNPISYKDPDGRSPQDDEFAEYFEQKIK